MIADDALLNRIFLVVDDEPFVRSVIVRYLKQAGAALVIEAADGRAAIDAVFSTDLAIDAIVSDLNMRPMTGLMLLQAIRTGEHGLKRNMPVVMLTAHAEARYVAQALALDADSFVIKPVARDDLLERLARILTRRVPVRSVAEYAAIDVSDNFFDGVNTAMRTRPPAPARIAAPEPARAPASAPVVEPAADADEAPEASAPEPKRSRRLALDAVEPDAILADDVLSKDGNVKFLVAGTVLTAALLARLRDLREINSALNTLAVRIPES